jgi:hypothetical protein
MSNDRAAYDELCAYTLTRGDAAFIHQHVVDAYTAQTATEQTKAIALTFALVGLYLHARGFTGKEVQRVHMQMAREKRAWPTLVLPGERGEVTAADVLAATDNAERDDAIHRWCDSVWRAVAINECAVETLLRDYAGATSGPRS